MSHNVGVIVTDDLYSYNLGFSATEPYTTTPSRKTATATSRHTSHPVMVN